MGKSKIILASGSPRRKELLLQIGIVPEIIVSHGKRRLNGAISYARIWTKALSDQQISEQSGKLLSEDRKSVV